MSVLPSHWLEVSSCFTRYREYRRLLGSRRNDKVTTHAEKVSTLIQQTSTEFLMWVLMSIGKQANQQLFYITLVRFRGFSRLGLDFGSRIGCMLPTTVFDIYFEELYTRLCDRIMSKWIFGWSPIFPCDVLFCFVTNTEATFQ